MEKNNNTIELMTELLSLMPPTRRREPSKHENLLELLERIYADPYLLSEATRIVETERWNEICRALNGGNGSSRLNGLDVN